MANHSFSEGTSNAFADVTLELTNMMDEKFAVTSKTSMWTPNPALVQGFKNAKTGKVATITTSGMGDYSDSGYPIGKASMTFEPYVLKYDRAVSFPLHNVDLMQSANIPTASAVLSEFMRAQVVPEVDACNIASVVARAQTDTAQVKTSYTPAKASILSTIQTGLQVIYDNTGIDEGINIHFNSKYRDILAGSSEFSRTKNIESKLASINTKVGDIDDNPITYVPSERMWSGIKLKDGTSTTATDDLGWAADTSAVEVVALLTAPGTAQSIVAHQITDIFPRSERIDGSIVNFHIYHDTIVPKQKIPGIYAILAPAASSRGATASSASEVPSQPDTGTETPTATKTVKKLTRKAS